MTFDPTIEQTDGVMVESVTGRPEDAVAVSTIGDALNVCVPGLANAMVWLACPATVRVKFCVTVVVLVALNTSGNVPVVVGDPWSKPVPAANVTPEGRVPELRASVGGGVPVAETVKLLPPVVEKVAAFALVKTGVLIRVNVKLAVSAASVGTSVTPHVLSASAFTAALETLAKLMTYGPAVALACGAKSKVASNWLDAETTGADPVAPKSATVAGLFTDNGTVETSLLGSV